MGSFIQPLHSLPRVLSKFLDMGMSWEEVLDAATVSPAKLINRLDLGTMKWGSVGDF